MAKIKCWTHEIRDANCARCQSETMSDVVVAQEDREAAWAYRPEGYDWNDYDAWMRGDMDDLAVIIDFARHAAQERKQALEEAAKVARDCALYDGKDRLLNSDIRATCAAAIRAIGDKG